MMQEALADISHQEENRSVLFSINSQSDAGGESEAQRRVDGCLGHFYLAKAPVTAVGQQFFYFYMGIETLFHRKRQRNDVAASKVSCSLKTFTRSEVILDASSDSPLNERRLVWDGASKPGE